MCMIYSFMDRLRLTENMNIKYIDDRQWYLAASEVPPIPDCTLLADRMIGYVRSMGVSHICEQRLYYSL